MAEVRKIALLIENSTYDRQLAQGIARYSRAHGPWAFYTTTPFYTDGGRKKRDLSRIKEWGITGIIARDSEITTQMIEAGLAIIVIGGEHETVYDLPNITSDDYKIGRIAAEYLLDRGFRHLAYCGLSDRYWSRRRAKSFQQSVLKTGFETHFYTQPVSRVWRSWGKEQTLLIEWLNSLPKPVGIMACNDERAGYVIDACRFAGLSVPYQVAVIGTDNDDHICELSNPRLSSIALNTEKGGYEAAELLDKLMAGKKTDDKTIFVQATHVVTRESTDIIAIEDPLVVEALRFIRRESRKLIQVEDVANSILCARRTLDERFCKILGRTVHAEIKRARIEQIIQMLVSTDLSVSRIALDFGYADVDHIARYFKQATGVSPVAYRRHYGYKRPG